MITLFSSNIDGGILQYAVQLLTELQKAGKECCLFLPENAAVTVPENLQDKIVSYTKYKTVNAKDQRLKELAGKILATKPEIVWFAESTIVSAQICCLLENKVSQYITVHDPAADHPTHNASIKYRMKKFLEHQMRAKSMNAADVIVLPSMESYRKFCEFDKKNKKKAVVFPLGAFLPAAEPVKPEELQENRKFYLFFGRIDKYKGIANMLKAYRKLLEDNGYAESGNRENIYAEAEPRANNCAESGTKENCCLEKGNSGNGRAINSIAENNIADNSSENDHAEDGSLESSGSENRCAEDGSIESSSSEKGLSQWQGKKAARTFAGIETPSLVIAGKGVFSDEEKSLIEQTGQNVIVLNRYMKDGEMLWLIAHAAVCMLPYVEASQSGILPISYYYGVPVIVSDLPGLTQFVEDGKTGFIGKDITGLTGAMKKVSALQPDALKENCKNYYDSNLDWGKNLRKLIKDSYRE